MDDALDPEKEMDEEVEDEMDADFNPAAVTKKGKGAKDDEEDDSFDALAEEEDAMLPEDRFDDVDEW